MLAVATLLRCCATTAMLVLDANEMRDDRRGGLTGRAVEIHVTVVPGTLCSSLCLSHRTGAGPTLGMLEAALGIFLEESWPDTASISVLVKYCGATAMSAYVSDELHSHSYSQTPSIGIHCLMYSLEVNTNS